MSYKPLLTEYREFLDTRVSRGEIQQDSADRDWRQANRLFEAMVGAHSIEEMVACAIQRGFKGDYTSAAKAMKWIVDARTRGD